MVDLSFFNKSKEHSVIKAEIVSRYLSVWAQVMCSRSPKALYVDLFAGPGRYADGTKSTPLLVLEKAIENPETRSKLLTIFSDLELKNAENLEKEIKTLPNIDKLKNAPEVYVGEVDSKLTELFQSTSLIPTLTFLDPWGYKGLTINLIQSVIKDWGSECIIFFNYNRINMGIKNDLVRLHIESLLGSENFNMLRATVDSMNPKERENNILGAFSSHLKSIGAKYVLTFKFISEKKNNTSHYIIFVTKHFLGYSLMKDIMASLSSSHVDGVASFEYSIQIKNQLSLFSMDSPLENLKNDLLKCYSGQSLHVEEIYQNHTVNTPYILKNYKEALLDLEEHGQICAMPEMTKRRIINGKRTMANTVVVTFPK